MNRRRRLLGAAALALLVVPGVVDLAVTTPRETLEALVEDAAAAVEEGDEEFLLRHLAPDFTGPGGRPRLDGRKAVESALEALWREFPGRSLEVDSLDVALDLPFADVKACLWALLESRALRIPARVDLEARLSFDGELWRVERLDRFRLSRGL